MGVSSAKTKHKSGSFSFLGGMQVCLLYVDLLQGNVSKGITAYLTYGHMKHFFYVPHVTWVNFSI